MRVRFRHTDASGREATFASVELLVDALEAGTLGPDDQVYDVARRRLVRVIEDADIRQAWDDRQRYRPRDDRRTLDRARPSNRLQFPAVTDGGVTPAHGVRDLDDLAARRAAFRRIVDRVAGVPNPAELTQPPVPPALFPVAPPVEERHAGERLLEHAALLVAFLVLVGVGVGVVALARGLAAPDTRPAGAAVVPTAS